MCLNVQTRTERARKEIEICAVNLFHGVVRFFSSSSSSSFHDVVSARGESFPQSNINIQSHARVLFYVKVSLFVVSLADLSRLHPRSVLLFVERLKGRGFFTRRLSVPARLCYCRVHFFLSFFSPFFISHRGCSSSSSSLSQSRSD